jgi:succinate-semialdehyde dehydrogenase/glutarate-semialdehyde dehydrogenase
LIDEQWIDGVSRDRLTDKYHGRVFGEMQVASPDQVDLAVTGADRREMTEERLITISY